MVQKYVQGIFKWQRTFHLNSLELNFEPKHSFYTILISSIKFIICMHVSTYKILVNDDLKIEFKIVSPIYRSMSTCTYQWHIGTFLTFNFDAIGLLYCVGVFWYVLRLFALVYLISKHNRHPLPILLWRQYNRVTKSTSHGDISP